MKKFFLSVFFSLFTTALFLLFLEGGARLYGHFKPRLNEYEQVVENQGFFPGNKLPGEKRVFVLGESAVEGVPYSREMSFTGFLNQLAQKGNLSGVQFINLGVKGRHSFYQREIAPLFVKYKADGVILYAGNNDTRDFSNVIGDLPGAYLDFILTWRSAFYAGFKRKIFSLQEKMNEKADKPVFALNHNSDDSWHWTDAYIQKKKKYMENPEEGLKRKASAVRDYENNLAALVKYLKSKKIPVYVCDLAINHKNIPSISDIKQGLGPNGKGYEIYYQNHFKNEAEKQSWDELFTQGNSSLSQKKYSDALSNFEKAAAITPLHPMLAYGRGEAFEGLGKFKEAKNDYLAARELEIQSPGGSPSKTAALKRTASRYQTGWIPVQKTLESLAPSGIVGDDFFLDHCHFNVYGHKVTAAAIMQSLCESKFLACPDSYSGWNEIFAQISEGKLDEKNLSNEYLMTAFYLINGTQWEKTPQYEKALFYLEKAYKLNSENEKIYPLLAETYRHLGRGQDADEFLKKIKTA